jgi:hypothetical protein
VAETLGITTEWAEVKQSHGNDVVRVGAPGRAGEADAIWTSEPGLPIAVFTADCLGVVLHAADATGVAHAGWRGAASGVVARLREEMSHAGHPPGRAAVGPGIGPCCFEVGPEVASLFTGFAAVTRWGTSSVDLPAVISSQLDGLDVWSSPSCTFHDEGLFSHRRDGTPMRLVSLGWST